MRMMPFGTTERAEPSRVAQLQAECAREVRAIELVLLAPGIEVIEVMP